MRPHTIVIKPAKEQQNRMKVEGSGTVEVVAVISKVPASNCELWPGRDSQPTQEFGSSKTGEVSYAAPVNVNWPASLFNIGPVLEPVARLPFKSTPLNPTASTSYDPGPRTTGAIAWNTS